MRADIQKSPPVKFLFIPPEEWEPVDQERQAEIIRALGDEVRWAIYSELEKSPVHSAKLLNALSKRHGDRITSKAMEGHIDVLRRAGLVSVETVAGKQMLRRELDVRVEVKRREEENREAVQSEFERDLKRALKGEPVTFRIHIKKVEIDSNIIQREFERDLKRALRGERTD